MNESWIMAHYCPGARTEQASKEQSWTNKFNPVLLGLITNTTVHYNASFFVYLLFAVYCLVLITTFGNMADSCLLHFIVLYLFCLLYLCLQINIYSWISPNAWFPGPTWASLIHVKGSVKPILQGSPFYLNLQNRMLCNGPDSPDSPQNCPFV